MCQYDALDKRLYQSKPLLSKLFEERRILIPFVFDQMMKEYARLGWGGA